jgi:hypoxanthine phosphoribosyltransferase
MHPQVDDSRRTLACAVSELEADIERERAQHEATSGPGSSPWQAPQLGVFVVHNKQREKRAALPADLMQHRCVAWLVWR